MRLILDLVIGINALAGLIGFGLRFHLKKRRLSHAEYQRQLEQENNELDQMRNRIEGRKDAK